MAQGKIEVGKRAPAFTLVNEEGNKVSLQTLKGKWVVLFFYPRDNTPGCTTEACEFTAASRQFERRNAVVLGCSPDKIDSHRKFIEKHKLKMPLLSDEKHQVMEKYGAWGEKTMYGRTTEGVIRSTVLIDPEGKVAHHWRRVRAAGHAEHVRKRLEELQKQ